jgi:hypothetical protein
MLRKDVLITRSSPEYLTLQLVSFDRPAIVSSLQQLLTASLMDRIRSLLRGPGEPVRWFHESLSKGAAHPQTNWEDLMYSAIRSGVPFDFSVADEDDLWSSFVFAGYLSRRGDLHLGISLKRDKLAGDLNTAESFLLALGHDLVARTNAGVGYLSLDGWPTWNGRVSSPLEAYFGLIEERLVRSLKERARGVYWANWWQRELIEGKVDIERVMENLRPIEQCWLPEKTHWYFRITDHAEQVTREVVREWMVALRPLMPEGRPVYYFPRQEWKV